MKQKTLLKVLMACFLLCCGANKVNAQKAIDRIATELEKRDDVSINSVIKRNPKTHKIIRVVKSYNTKDPRLAKSLVEAFEKDEEYAETAIKDIPQGRNSGLKVNFTFIFSSENEKRTCTLNTNANGSISFTIIIKPLKDGKEIASKNRIRIEGNEDKDIVLNATSIQALKSLENARIHGKVYVNGKQVKNYN